MNDSLALIGFGEAGLTFASAGKWQSASVWDLRASRLALAEQSDLVAAPDAKSALATADLVLCLVTADQALECAKQYAPLLQEGAIWCDMNSVAPQTKLAAAEVIHAAGAHYVDVAILAPVEPARMSVPLLIAGPQSAAAEQRLNSLGFASSRIVSDEIGKAAAIKMIRSVMVKGIEALTYECAAAADEAGVFDEVMASLDASEKNWSWRKRTEYNQERMQTHGVRRAAEMEEVAKTLSGFGVEPVMTQGTVKRQRAAALAHKERIKAA